MVWLEAVILGLTLSAMVIILVGLFLNSRQMHALDELRAAIEVQSTLLDKELARFKLRTAGVDEEHVEN